MSGRNVDNLTAEIVEQLLAAVGSRPTEETSQLEVAEYDWHQPHYFTSAQREALEDFTDNIAAAVAERLTNLFKSNFHIKISSVTEHFAAEFISQASETSQQRYHLAFGPDQAQPCGFVAIDPKTAATWVKVLLGDSESQDDTAGQLSQLEESLLLDIATATVDGLIVSLRDYCDLHCSQTISIGRLPVDLQEADILCKITFSVKRADSEEASESYFLMPCHILTPVVGELGEAPNRQSADDVSNAIRVCLQPIPVSVTAQLGKAMLTFEEIASIRPGDILLLDKPIHEPVEVVIDGRTVFYGRPVKSGGQQAVKITKSHHHRTEESNEMAGVHAPA